MNYQFTVLDKIIGYDGFFRMEKYRLRHELFQGGWSPDITRECLERGHAVAGAATGFCLALGAAFTIANVVRLTILLHRDEIDILRLVGAPEILIRGPFLLGGVFQGLLGGLLALGLLGLAFRGVLLFIAATENVLLGVFVVRFLSPATCGLLVLGGVLAGLVGGTLASRRRHV